jgi:hypothetical protein
LLFALNSALGGSIFFAELCSFLPYAKAMNELPIIQKTYDLIEWYIPHLNKLHRDFKFSLGDRITSGLYDLLEGLLRARFAQNKRELLIELNNSLDILRYQTRLLHSFKLITTQRYEFASAALNNIGLELGGWIKQQGKKIHESPRQPLATNRQL